MDFLLNREGTISVLVALTPEAREWDDEHLPPDRMRFCGGVVIEHRFVDPIVAGIREDGLTLEER